MPSAVPTDKFMAQIAFKYALNYEFVTANDGGNQIFQYLPKAIADSLNITVDQVINYGIRGVDTAAYKHWITTLAVFMIPKDLNTTLALKVQQPASEFYHNPDPTVEQLTAIVDSTWPLQYGMLPGDKSPSSTYDPQGPATNQASYGGAMGGDIGASRKVNPMSAGIAASAVLAAGAYGAAMIFVARRYRKKKMMHQRSSSVPSTNRYTYGSVAGPAWMSGARNGRLTPGGPGSRGSRGSSSSNGRSIRTQQISAPVMAENSLGWN